jgi:hypothetical protein
VIPADPNQLGKPASIIPITLVHPRSRFQIDTYKSVLREAFGVNIS